jgi:hypothetical protein
LKKLADTKYGKSRKLVNLGEYKMADEETQVTLENGVVKIVSNPHDNMLTIEFVAAEEPEGSNFYFISTQTEQESTKLILEFNVTSTNEVS